MFSRVKITVLMISKFATINLYSFIEVQMYHLKVWGQKDFSLSFKEIYLYSARTQ